MPRLNIVLPVAFGFVAAVALVGVDFASQAAASKGGFGLRSYISGVKTRAAAMKTPAAPKLTVDATFPKAPKGWTSDEMKVADLALVTGRPVDESMSREAVFAAGMLPGMPHVSSPLYRTYTDGTNAVLIRIDVVKSGHLTGPNGPQLSMLLDAMGLEALTHSYFATVNGLVFTEAPDRMFGTGRRFLGQIGNQIDVSVVSASDDDTILAVLSGLDVAGLNSLAVHPVEGIGTPGISREAPAGIPGQDAAAVGADVFAQYGVELSEADQKAMGATLGAAAALMSGRSPDQSLDVAKAAVTDEVAPEEEEKSSGGMLSGFFGGGDDADDAEVEVEAEAEPVPKVELPEMSCTIDKGFKRCKIGG